MRASASPSRMRPAELGDPRRHAHLEQNDFALLLVGIPRAAQLRRKTKLPRVVKSRSDENDLRIDAKREGARKRPKQAFRRLDDQLVMAQESGRRAECLEERKRVPGRRQKLSTKGCPRARSGECPL